MRTIGTLPEEENRPVAWRKWAALFLAGTALATSGCTFTGKIGESLSNYILAETGEYIRKPNRDNVEYKSNDPKDYILPDGSGIAIPAKAAFDLYISPFAPEAGYISSKQPPGTTVVCPFTGKRLVLGHREHVAEKELP